MPRPKGSKNKAKISKEDSLETLIAEESESIASLEEELSAVEAEIAELTAKQKSLKADLKKASKKLHAYEEKKAQEEAVAAAAAAKEALSDKIDELLQNGMSLEDILNKLN